MKLSRLARSRTATVLGAAGLLAVAGGTGGAVAAHQIHSNQIANNTIQSRDIHNGTILNRDLHTNAVHESRLSAGVRDKLNAQGLKLGDPNWSIIDRNVEGNGASYLRTGPTSPGDNGTVPAGVGSLGMRTGSATDKAAYGDQVDFAGKKLADMTDPSYYLYVTGEDLDKNADNGINLQMEINPGSGSSSKYSTLTFVPTGQQANQWTKLDAGNMKRWYLTGQAGQDTGCNTVTYCTLDEVNQKLPDATLISVQFSKGKDFAFSGAVDDLTIGGTTYDFEPTGVMH